MSELLDNKVSPFETDAQATTALHRAAAAGQDQACRLLCRAGAVGFAKNSQNLTAHDLAVQNWHVGARRIFQPSASDLDLIEAAAISGQDGWQSQGRHDAWKSEAHEPFVTPLMRAALQGDLEDVKDLITSKGTEQLNKRSKRRCTALLIAAEEGHVEVITALFENKKKRHDIGFTVPA